MKVPKSPTRRFAITLSLLLSIFAVAAFAGPTLICHQFDIGNAKSLPWISHDWNLTGGKSYDTHHLAADTIAILDADPTVLVHMETLRRATLFARRDPQAAKELLTRLVARAESASQSNTMQALANFDAGYLAETYKQWLGKNDKDEANPAKGLDGYALVKKAIRLRGDDPQMEFAAALICLPGPAGEQMDHAQKAFAGAKNDPLLARNLATHFMGPQSQTLAELINRSKMAKE